MNNQYDDPSFFQAYNEMPRSQKGLMAAGEWPQFVSMLPDLKDKTILDLGCGYGWHCMYAAKQNARHVVGIDASHRMIDQAIKIHSHPNIVYQVCDLTKYAYPIEQFDVVISNLVLHYIEDLDVIYQNIYRTLKSSGIFVMNIEHPTFTAVSMKIGFMINKVMPYIGLWINIIIQGKGKLYFWVKLFTNNIIH